ncbi:MAG TPA: 2-hydroxychromene-2-carboxylate isomerase [Steroidobacteraceae bacterium]|nr:2-hydroxychromene-2-carboxylate isomerase [Steroidobacteraceae bacterium]
MSAIDPKPVGEPDGSGTRDKALDFWFEFGSNYSYLSVMRIEAAAARAAVRICWKPFLLSPIFRSLGWSSSPFVQQKEKGEYVWRDMARQCAKYGLPWKHPTSFPRRALLPMRVALYGAREPWIGEFCRRIMCANFAEDQDIDSPRLVGPILEELGVAAGTVLQGAQSETNKQLLREQTERARALGIFGAPTFFVGEEMFWGNDRLEDALAQCSAAPRG